jgi:acetyl-CoA C-acetyltransferase
MGQAPAKQAAIYGGLDIKATCTTINKVCASGMKSIVYGTQSIQLGHSSIVLVGGFESMSNAPHLVMNVLTFYIVGKERNRSWR